MNIITCDLAKQCAQQEMKKMFDTIPFTRDFHMGNQTNKQYYLRHLIETILRIRLNNEVDAYCLYKIGFKNDPLAIKLAQYLSEEIGHESFFMHDLDSFNVSKAELDQTSVFFATKKLIGYLYYCINQDGPLATMVWNWFVEWYSDTYNTAITQKASTDLGTRHTEGFIGHIEFDEGHDHVGLMFSTVELAIKNETDSNMVKMYISNFIQLLGEYFLELYNDTMLNQCEKLAS